MKALLHIDVAPFTGGAQASLATLIEALPYRQNLLANSTLGIEAPSVNFTQIRTAHWTKSPVGACQLLLDAQRCKSAIRENAAEASLVNLNTIRSALLYCLCRQKVGPPVVIHDRDLQAPGLVVRKLARDLSPCVIAVSEKVARKWRGLLPEDAIHVIPNAFNLASIQAHRTKKHFPRLILAGDFVGWKRHLLFLEALKILHERGVPCTALLKGRIRPGEERVYNSVLQAVSRFGLATKVKIDTTGGSALEAIGQSTLLISCSESEAFGRTIVEASALGLPAIVTPGAFPREFALPGYPIYCQQDNAQSLANCLEAAINDTPTVPPAFAEQFSLENIIPQITVVYEKLLLK